MARHNKTIAAFRGLTIVMASIFALGIGMSIGAFQNETDINENLNTTSREFIVDEENATYKSSYTSWQAMTEAKHENIKNTMGEGIVLLKNDGVLPLDKSKDDKINIFGRNSEDPAYGGAAGAGQVSDNNIVDVKTAFNNAGITINDTLYDYYSSCDSSSIQQSMGPMTTGSFSTGEADPAEYPTSVTETFSQYGETAIIWFKRCLGEGTDPEPGYMEMDDNETALVEYVEGLSSVKNIVVILNEDNVRGIGDLANDDRINAILHVGGLGINGTEALVDILYGVTNPSGHLSDTYAAYSMSSPAAQNMYDHQFSNYSEVEDYVGGSNEYATHYIAEKEGIYVGYRYYETRYEDSILNTSSNASSSYGAFVEDTWNYDAEVSYPFGYGLSYTTFSQTLDGVNVAKDGTITATVTVTNTGSVAGKSVVEFYAQSPYTQYDMENNVEKSAIQLMNYAKTSELKPDDKETVTIEADMEFLASYDYTKARTYILDDGDYYFAIGDSAHDALNNVIAAKSPSKAPTESDATKAYKYTIDKFDDETYSVSSATGAEITNLFDDADYNYFFDKDQYTYLTRKDWSTFPTTEDDLVATQEMMYRLSGQADLWPEEDGSPHDFSNGDYDDVAVVNVDSDSDVDFTLLYGVDDYDDPTWEQVLSKMSWTEMATFTQGNSITREIASIGWGGSVDGDGPAGFSGYFDEGVSDLTARTYQSQCTLASTWNQDLAYAQGRFMGEDGYYLGKTSIWAPGQNLHRTPYSGRNFEYYSEDSMLAYYMGANQSKGIQDMGCIACPKHFAFNDQEKNRCSLVTLINEQEARELQLRCFQGSFVEGGALGTMTSFTRIGCVFAGASHALLTDLLRGEWGFKGYTISDYAAWDFMHPLECLQAGTDMFDTTATTYSDPILEACQSGDVVTQAALREANKRVLYAYANSHAVEGYSVKVTPWWKAAIYGVDIALGVITVGFCVTFICLEAVGSKKKKGDGDTDKA